jgi:hypothetical protein
VAAKAVDGAPKYPRVQLRTPPLKAPVVTGSRTPDPRSTGT